MYPELKLFIAGEWRTTASDMPVVNPATEQELGRLPRAAKSDLDDALEAARGRRPSSCSVAGFTTGM